MSLLIWASMWMLLVPLVHMHSEVDHHHGEVAHVHSGTIHTVFSQDLDGDFVSHDPHDPLAEAANIGIVLSTQSSHADQEYPEFGFSLLRDSSDRKSFKPLLIQIAFVTVEVVLIPEPVYSAEEDNPSVPSSGAFVFDRPTRAPPSLLL